MNSQDLKIFQDIPTLQTSRLSLRKIEYSDIDAVFEYASREEVTKYLLWSAHETKAFTKAYLREVQKQYRRHNFFDWAITLKNENKMLGTCGFSSFNLIHNTGEIGYVLSPDYWNKGIATEAARMVITFGFEVLDLNRIEAKFMIENNQSRRVLEKCGMKPEGIKREGIYAKGRYRDVEIYSITKSDYEKLKSRNT